MRGPGDLRRKTFCRDLKLSSREFYLKIQFKTKWYLHGIECYKHDGDHSEKSNIVE